jgi:oligosaccharyltransferase complex subunit alpha (ribophorin I)
MAHYSFLARWLVHVLLLGVVYGVVNEEVTRNIDASSALVRVNYDIKVKDASKEYLFVVPAEWSHNIAYFRASVGKGKKSIPTAAPVSEGNFTTYKLTLKDANNPSIKIKMILTDLLIPRPKQIRQEENQMVQLLTDHYFYSPYHTSSQKTTIKLASSQIESYTKKAPHSARGSTLTWGPYADIAPETQSPAIVHYTNNKPFSKFTDSVIELEVSHWGNVAIEEIHELKHTGAELIGGFSRIDYQMRRSASTPSFRNLIGTLPAQAHSMYYRDQIGNISTSDLRVVDGALELDLQTRFPIFGGWKTQFYFGYSVPTDTMLSYDPESGKYKLKFDLFTIFEDVWIGELDVKLILPEGCTDIQVDLPQGSYEQLWTRRFTYLDSVLNGGRPVLTIRAKNLVEELDSIVTVSYNFDHWRLLVEPFMLCFSFFAFFLLASLIKSLTSGNGEKEETQTETAVEGSTSQKKDGSAIKVD